MCACLPGDCPDVRTTLSDNGKTVVLEVGQWISLELPGPNTGVTAGSSEPSILKLVGKQRLGNYGKGDVVYMSFNALKAGSAQLTFGYKSCDASSPAHCSYEVNARVVQFPQTKVTVSVDVSATPTVQRRVGESVRFAGCCQYSPDELKVTIDRPDVMRWAVEPFVNHQYVIEGAVTAVSPGTAHIQGDYCPQTTGSYCPSTWSLTVVVD
jgi:hypothetical protein